MQNFKVIIINIVKKIFRKMALVMDIYLSSEIPLYSSNAAFYFIVSSIPLSMLMFSTISLIPNVQVDDIINHLNYLFPNLPYVSRVVNYVIRIARSLSSKGQISLNILIAMFTASSALHTFLIGIRRIHNITHQSNFFYLRLISFINMFVFLIAITIMLIAFIFGSMIIGYVKIYLPFAEDLIDTIFGFKYLVAFFVLLVLIMSIYSTSTNFERKVRHNIVGALVSTIIWLLISNIFSIYFKRFPLNASIYGSLAGIVVILLWLNVCMNIIFLGAAINEVVYPERRILYDMKVAILKEINDGNDETVDKIISKRLNLSSIQKALRPKLNKDNFYE